MLAERDGGQHLGATSSCSRAVPTAAEVCAPLRTPAFSLAFGSLQFIVPFSVSEESLGEPPAQIVVSREEGGLVPVGGVPPDPAARKVNKVGT